MENNQALSKLNDFFKQQALHKILGKCPLCNFENKVLKTKILCDNDESQLLYYKCNQCLNSIIILVMNTGAVISSMGLITDLTESDIIKFVKYNKILDEDIINIHKVLKSKYFCYNFKNNKSL